MAVNKHFLALFGIIPALVFLFSGCTTTHSAQEKIARDRLASARAAYALAKADPQVEANAGSALLDAERTLDAAGQVRDFDEMNHFAYLAEQQTRIAVAMAKIKSTRQKSNELRRENQQMIGELSARGRRNQDPEAARREEGAAAAE